MTGCIGQVREQNVWCHLALTYTSCFFCCVLVGATPAFQTGLKLPGSRSDVVRTKSLSGPSPVGGAMGGYESQNVYPLDEFELQAAHYNIACAHAQLGNLDEVSKTNDCGGEYRFSI